MARFEFWFLFMFFSCNSDDHSSILIIIIFHVEFSAFWIEFRGLGKIITGILTKSLYINLYILTRRFKKW
ncbi:hypothetical protein Hanom_Chr03g00275731 [Helianthus anomalus]